MTTDDVLVAVRDRLARDGGDVTPQRVAEALRRGGRPVGDAEVLAVHDALRRDVLGGGPLEDLIALPDVTDVLVNGPDQVWIDRGDGLERTTVRFDDDGAVRRLAQRWAAVGGRRLDDAAPYADVRLPDGTRLHAILAPIARPGTTLSLRIPRERSLDLDAMQAAGTVSAEGSQLLRRIVAARLSFLVTGGTGSGKTTLLAALLALVDHTERVVLWRSLRSSSPIIRTYSDSRRGRRTSRAPVKSPCAHSYARPCGCAPTDLSSERSAEQRLLICSPR